MHSSGVVKPWIPTTLLCPVSQREIWSMLFTVGNLHASLMLWCWFKSHLLRLPTLFFLIYYFPFFNILHLIYGVQELPLLYTCQIFVGLCAALSHTAVVSLPETALQWWAKWSHVQYRIHKQREILWGFSVLILTSISVFLSTLLPSPLSFLLHPWCTWSLCSIPHQQGVSSAHSWV